MDLHGKNIKDVATNASLSGSLALAGLGIEALAHNPLFMVAGGVVAYASWKYGAGEKLLDLKKQIVEGGINTVVAPARLEQRATVNEAAHDEDDELHAPSSLPAGLFTFSSVLRNFRPSLERIYLGQLEDGTAVYCAAKDLCHIALAGATGNGKSSIMRMLMAQLCAAGANVLLLNPHFTRYDMEASTPEDWTPFEPYLMHDPMETRKYAVIGYYLKQVATELLVKRLDKYAHSKKLGKPYFIVLDELPAIVDEVPDAALYLSKILKQGRKVGIYLISSSQDFLVKSIDPSGKDGGAVRKCYRTAYYTGGDQTTANILLGQGQKIAENQLGKGTVILRNDPAVKEPQICRVPFTDNEALYTLLGPSTFEFEDEDESDVIYHPGEKQTDDLEASSFWDDFAQASRDVHGARPDTDDPIPATRMAPLPMRVPETPVLPEKSRLADDLPMAAVIALWNAKGGMSINELAATWDIKRNQAEKLQKKILASVQEAQQGTQIDEE